MIRKFIVKEKYTPFCIIYIPLCYKNERLSKIIGKINKKNWIKSVKLEQFWSILIPNLNLKVFCIDSLMIYAW